MRGRVADCTDEWPPFHVHSVAFLQALALGDYPPVQDRGHLESRAAHASNKLIRN
jgi:hypothetical protein